MDKDIIYMRHLLPFDKDESFQAFGDIQFYRSGGAKLPPVFYAYGTPIHRERFGANLIALRYHEQPNILEIELPFGGELIFQYRPLFRKWYQLMKVDCPWLYAYRDKYGFHVAVALYHLHWAFKWLLAGVIQGLLYLLIWSSFVLVLLLYHWFF